MPYALAGLITLGLWFFCLLDLITCDRAGVRYLPKLVWLPIMVLLPAIGSALWLLVGRPLEEQPRRVWEPERAEVFAARRNEDDEQFLRQCRERAEAQRQEWRRRQREAGES